MARDTKGRLKNTSKTRTVKRTDHAKRSSKPDKKTTIFRMIGRKVSSFMARRPHRSFRRTRRRDYMRSLQLPGYWAFTGQVLSVLRDSRKQVLLLGLLYVLVSGVFLGLGSQESFTTLRETLSEAGAYITDGDWSAMGEASLLALSTVAGSLSPSLTEAQQVYAIILGLLMWLALVWLLRQKRAGGSVRVRDALYNAGAPIIPTTLLFVVLLLQLLPIALVAIGYSAAQATGLLAGGVEAMLFWAAATGLAALSLYWLSSTALALVIVTLPGMYPMRALRIAGDMVVGRRLRILYRVLWMLLGVVVMWAAVLIPIIMLDTGLKDIWPVIAWLPTIPVVVLVLSCLSFIWVASYVYLLYRGIVDDDAKPA